MRTQFSSFFKKSLVTKFGGRNLILIVLAIVCAGVIGFLKLFREPVIRQAVPFTAAYNYKKSVAKCGAEADARNQVAVEKFRADIRQVLDTHKTQLEKAAKKAAKEVSDLQSCCKLVGFLGWDKIRGTHYTNEYLIKEIEPVLAPVIRDLSRDVHKEYGELHQALGKNTARLAMDLATLYPDSGKSDAWLRIDLKGGGNMDKALRNLGFNGMGVGVSMGFDTVAVCNAGIVKLLGGKCVRLATSLFSKQAVKASASLAVAAGDGPLPIGDIIAIGGLVWTGFDIYSAKKQFRKEIGITFDDLITQSLSHIQLEVEKAGKSLLAKAKADQEKVKSNAIKDSKGGK